MLINVLLRHLYVQPHRTSTHIHVLSGIRARDPVLQSPRPYVPLRLYSHCHQQKLNTTVQSPVYWPHLIHHLSESLVIPTIARYCPCRFGNNSETKFAVCSCLKAKRVSLAFRHMIINSGVKQKTISGFTLNHIKLLSCTLNHEVCKLRNLVTSVTS
jgi:hypothetical protein